MVVGAHWSFGGAASGSTETDPLVRFNAEGDVLVTLEATLTCGLVLVERTIRLQDCTDSCSVWIPSSFTPDNDGINDTWSGTSECAAEDYTVQVFDRWGEIVFSANDPLLPWDGTFQGKALPAGVYAYRVEYRLPYQKNREVAGSITLVR
jgi:gliding motility-associated-like protein